MSEDTQPQPQLDSDDVVALQFLVGLITVFVGAWLIAPALALVLSGGILLVGAARRLR